MYFISILISIVVLIITRLYYVTYDHFWPKKTKIDNNLIESKLRYRVNKLDINFGTKLYKQLRQSDNRFNDYLPNLFSKSSLNGINYCVHYIDTNEGTIESAGDEVVAKTDETLTTSDEQMAETDANDKCAPKPVIVLLHGTPGCVLDFEEFCHEFGDKYRLIILQFPDFELTRKTEYFMHTNEERVDIVVTFLNRLGVNEIDCLVCHSGGNPVALQIISGEFDGKLVVKSLVMITPPGFKWLSEFQLKTTRPFCRTITIWWRRWLYLFLMPDWLKKLFGVPETLLKNCTKDELFCMTLVAALSGFEVNIKQRYELLAAKQVPTLFVMAEKDRLFPKWKSEKTLEFMDANREELFTNIGLNGEYESKPTVRQWIQVLNFRFGGHFCFIKYSKVFHKQFQQFFESLQTSVQTSLN